MSLVNLLLCLMAFIGALCGVALAFIAPEEIKPYRRYLVLFASLMFSLSALMPFIYQHTHIILVIVAFVLLFFLARQFSHYLRYAFPLLGFSIMSTSGLHMTLSCLFLFALGLPLGSLDMLPYISDNKLRFNLYRILNRIWPYSLIALAALSYLILF